MAKVRTLLECRTCGRQLARWAGRCPACGAWGTIDGKTIPVGGAGAQPFVVSTLEAHAPESRVRTGFPGMDRVLGGGFVPGSVVLLAGEPGIGKSTLLLQLLGLLSNAGLPCLLASGEESREQVAERARRLGIPGDSVLFTSGRDVSGVVEAARRVSPFLLAVDSIQTLRHPDVPGAVGGPAQVRASADALVELAKRDGTVVLMTGQVTKDGEAAGPRSLEHVVDVLLGFEGDRHSGRRILASGKNRFGPEGELSWFEMEPGGLRHVEVTGEPTSGEPGAALALPRAGGRALAVEVQALVVSGDRGGRRQVSGLDPRRFHLLAAVTEHATGLPLASADLFAATAGGLTVEDPACDLAVVAALVSAATGVPVPSGTAFLGEVSLTGRIRGVPTVETRLRAARRSGAHEVVGPPGCGPGVTGVPNVQTACAWTFTPKVSTTSTRYRNPEYAA